MLNPAIDCTRHEFDFANHIASTIETDPEAEWVFIFDLKQKIPDFIAYFNRTLAKPFNGKFEGFPEPS